MFEELIPLAAIAFVFGIPIVAILTAHQRKMAELIHGKGNQQHSQEFAYMQQQVQELRSEVATLRDRLNEQILAMEVRNPASGGLLGSANQQNIEQ